MKTPTVIHFDGGTRPDNPGPSDIGYIVETDVWTEEQNEHIGKSTNNRTEYRALIQGLELASKKGCTEVEARGDSELVVKQVRGEYGVNQPELRPLRNRVQELADEFKEFEIHYIPREENREADALVEQAFSD
jgi:ribonuclease HI